LKRVLKVDIYLTHHLNTDTFVCKVAFILGDNNIFVIENGNEEIKISICP